MSLSVYNLNGGSVSQEQRTNKNIFKIARYMTLGNQQLSANY